MNGPVKSLLNVAVIEDDVGALATELEGGVLQVCPGSSLEDLATDESGTSEGDLLDVGVDGDGVTDTGTIAVDNVDDTRREASLVDELSGEEGGERSEFGRLEDDTVAGSESGAELPGQHHDYKFVRTRGRNRI